jgi:hypothetical protein
VVGDPAPRARQGSTAAASMGAALCRSRFGARNRGEVGRFNELRAGAGCVAPPLAGDNGGGLAGLGFGGARRRRLRRPRVAQAERREGPSTRTTLVAHLDSMF